VVAASVALENKAIGKAAATTKLVFMTNTEVVGFIFTMNVHI